MEPIANRQTAPDAKRLLAEHAVPDAGREEPESSLDEDPGDDEDWDCGL
jgi:hypothetical protein